MEEETTKRNSFAFYRSFMDAIETIPDVLKKAQAYKVIVEYGLNGIEPNNNEDFVVKVIFTQAKPQIDASTKRYDNCVKNGKKGGAPKGNTNAKTTKKQPRNNQENNQKTTLNHNDNLNDNDNYNDNLNERDLSLLEQNGVLQDISLKYPNIEMDINNIENFDITKYDIKQIEDAIKNSDYLQGATISYIIKNYEKVISGFYKSFTKQIEKKLSTESVHNYDNRKYAEEDYNSLYTDLSDIDL